MIELGGFLMSVTNRESVDDFGVREVKISQQQPDNEERPSKVRPRVQIPRHIWIPLPT
jgi:hypothetical protein